MSKPAWIAVAAFLALVALTQRASAADLQAGWYAKIWTTNIYVPGPEGPYLFWDTYFPDTPPGQYGPFLVTDGPYHSESHRWVTVPSPAYGVGPGQSLVMPLYLCLGLGDPISYLEISTGTNYDSSQMRLELWRTRYSGARELVWSQLASGQVGWSGAVASNTVYEGPYYWKVDVLPEPSSLVAVGGGIIALGLGSQRRRVS